MTFWANVFFYNRTPVNLWPIRMARRLTRAVFGGPIPDWAGDLYDMLEYVNFLSLLPTVGAIMTSPDHFFRRVGLIRKKKKPYYKPPVKFLTSVLTLQIAALKAVPAWIVLWSFDLGLKYLELPTLDFALFASAHQKLAEYLVLLLPVVFCPLWILLPCLILAVIGRLISPGKELTSPPLNYHLCLVPWIANSYRSIKLKSAFWGFVYFGIYALSTTVIISIILGFFLAGFLTDSSPNLASGIANRIALYQIPTVISALQFLLVKPYVSLMSTAMVYPTKRVMMANLYEVSWLCQWQVRNGPLLRVREKAKQYAKLLSDTSSDLQALRTIQERQILKIEPAALPRLRADYLRLLRSMVDFRGLQTSVPFVHADYAAIIFRTLWRVEAEMSPACLAEATISDRPIVTLPEAIEIGNAGTMTDA